MQPAKTNSAVATLPKNSPLKPIESSMGPRGPFVQHPHTMAPNYAKIAAAAPKGVKPGKDTPVYVNGEEIVFLQPFTFFVTPLYDHYLATLDNQGKTVSTHDIGTGGDSLTEIIDSVVVVLVDDKFRPAQMRVKRAECVLLRSAIDQLLAMKPEDKQYAKLVKSGLESYLYLAFTASYTNTPSKKPGGRAYFKPEATGAVVDEKATKAMLAATKSDEFLEELSGCMAAFEDLKTRNDKLRG